MFAAFLKTLLDGPQSPLAPQDAKLSLAALMVRIARSDGSYDTEEIVTIDTLLGARYAMETAEVVKLRRDAETLESEAPDTVRFTRAIKDAVAYEDRIAVIEDLWSIVLADGVRDAEEDSLVRLVASLLGVSDVDSATARQKVSRRA
mgnify:CR=1 FL=1